MQVPFELPQETHNGHSEVPYAFHLPKDANQLKYVCRTFHMDTKRRALFSNDLTFQRHTEEQPSTLVQFNAFFKQCSERNKRRIGTIYLRSKSPEMGSLGDASRMSIPDDLPLPVFYPRDIALFQNLTQFCLDFPKATVFLRLNGFADGNNRISYHALGMSMNGLGGVYMWCGNTLRDITCRIKSVRD
ncbi:hypothetical protein PtrSN002B_011761 [Pyrenophora tritici-repentis]|nr:hypothetical protein Alg215_11685 [Pyrenophora tritici-repentis]KAI0570067.1 hypothetical protein Alg130_11368 [Pyrenophora tritici-repentis]KAI0604427.1 hypothetical protein TUN205_11325 [Pyrenophora tritici-repentis]KAI0616655.1 hypothetical protein TUN199_11353 [Pyrenophora tritici-repentis]KAI1522675.1 hypothetical protein PtrSN001A_011645 [Pyrenophora tritici-repentis]